MNKNTLKVAFFHFKDNKDATHTYESNDGVKQIKDTMRCNEAVLDAILYVETNEITTYTNNITKSDIFANGYGN